jgi:transposase
MGSDFWLSEAQFERLRPFLPNKPRGVARVDDRRVISGIVHVLITGGRWADAPLAYGPRKTLYNRWVRWAKAGVWRRAFDELDAAGGPSSELMLDSTWAKARRSAAGGKGGPAPTA